MYEQKLSPCCCCCCCQQNQIIYAAVLQTSSNNFLQIVTYHKQKGQKRWHKVAQLGKTRLLEARGLKNIYIYMYRIIWICIQTNISQYKPQRAVPCTLVTYFFLSEVLRAVAVHCLSPSYSRVCCSTFHSVNVELDLHPQFQYQDLR